jgi:hypothetical protein
MVLVYHERWDGQALVIRKKETESHTNTGGGQRFPETAPVAIVKIHLPSIFASDLHVPAVVGSKTERALRVPDKAASSRKDDGFHHHL